MNATRVAGLCVAVFLVSPLHADLLAGWEITGQNGWGSQGLAATSSLAGLSAGGLTRGPGVGTGGSPSANGWGGRGWHAETYEDGIAAGAFVTFSITPDEGAEVSVETLHLNYRRSTSGPAFAAVQFQVGSGDFIDVEEFEMEVINSPGGSINPIDLTSIPELQGHSGSPITFRVIPYAAPQDTGEFYIWGEIGGMDLRLEGTVDGAGEGDITPPVIISKTPADNATGVLPPTFLTAIFSENVARGSGVIRVRETGGGPVVNEIDVTDTTRVLITANQVELVMSTPLEGETGYQVEIPEGAFRDLAPVPNDFAGLAEPGDWNFTTAAVVTPPSVVVNKFFNGTPDRIELLVVGNGMPAGTVDLRGMVVKDFSNDMTADGGGKLVFNDVALWSEVPVGTLVVLSNREMSPDLAAADFTLSVGLKDATYFTAVAGAPELDLTATDMVMIKEAGSDPAGTAGGIHAFASGTAPALSFFSSFTGAKLRSPATAGTNLGVRANNGSATLADFSSGTDASGDIALALADFGAPNNGPNAAYIASLRGYAAGSGDGTAVVTNATLGSPLFGRPMFDAGSTNQTVKASLVAQAGTATLTQVLLTIPADLGEPGAVTLAGPGAAGASHFVSGQTIIIDSAQITPADALEVTIGGLSMPVPSLAGETGNYPLQIATAGIGANPSPIAAVPAVRVTLPVGSLRDIDAAGVALDSGEVVVVDGIVTEADFGGGAANFSAFLQDASGGINVFSPSINLGLVRSTRVTLTGTVAQINGQTAIIPASGSHVVARTTVPEPVAAEFTVAALLAAAEANEGRLVKVRNLSLHAGTWAAGETVVLKNAAGEQIEVRILSGSTATTPPAFPVTVTGVLGQADAAAPFDAGYHLLPRDSADLESANDFELWLAAQGLADGMGGDSDRDGLDNGTEYAFGLNPKSAASSNPYAALLNRSTGKFRYIRRLASLTGLSYRVFTSENLSTWTEDSGATAVVVATHGEVETVEVTLGGTLPLTQPKRFVKVTTP
jgi:hypothetical protein